MDLKQPASTAAKTSTIPTAPASGAYRPRLWGLVFCVALYWVARWLVGWLELPAFFAFLFFLAAAPLLTLGLMGLWMFNRRVPRGERWSVLLLAGVTTTAAAFLAHKTVGPLMMVMMGLPVVWSIWVGWLLLTQIAPAGVRLAGAVAVFVLTWGFFTLLRNEGLTGDQKPQLYWRWTPSAEQRYLAAGSTSAATRPSATAVVLSPGDWPAFRGSRRDGVVRGLRIDENWTASPPLQLWRRSIGPAWSSMVVVGGRLYTQEQRGDDEAVTCLDAATGREIWTHLDPGRYWDGQSGAGPRATPAFDGGRIFALGGNGLLNCLDATSGKVIWSKKITADSGGDVPNWGFCGSPLVENGVVLVFGGGSKGKGLLAYRADTGDLAWTADGGSMTYCSPQPASLNGREAALMLADRGLLAVDPADGKTLWLHDVASQAPRTVQPCVVGGQALFSTGMDAETALVDLPASSDAKPTPKWTSRQLKPTFNDFVVDGENIFGFDGGMFCCVELASGKRRWKQGRYGRGQTLLLADQHLLIVAAETGEVVLLAADPAGHRELGQFTAVGGKVWNHPAVAQGKLYVRSDQEIACYDLRPRNATVAMDSR